MGYLILGGTGTVGNTVVNKLLEQGKSVRVLTRSAEKAASLPPGATGVVGDLQDPGTFQQIFSEAESLFLLNAVVPTELQEGLAAVNEAQRVGTRHIVYISVQDVKKGPHIPHFASKIAIEEAIKESGIAYTILRPNNFYQNDLWLKDVILNYGIYPQPIGDAGISRVDVGDIAQAAVNAFMQAGHENKTYTLAGPEPLTGEDCARVYSDTLGQEVRYGGNDLEGWRQQALQSMPSWMVYDLQLMFAMFQDKGLIASEGQIKETETILGKKPRSFRDFVQEAVANWK